MDGRERSSSCTPSPETLTPSSGIELEQEDVVMSEVHLGCPPNFSGPHISRFTFSLPSEADSSGSKYIDAVKDEANINQVLTIDEDGDLVITRRNRQHKDNYVATIQHNITSSIPSVGLQVWRAELILADFILHKMVTSSEFNGIVAIELGAGTGLVGILLSRVARTVILTDRGDEVLDNCADNVRLNSKMFDPQAASVYVRELDWKDSWPPKVVENSSFQNRYAWTSAEVEELCRASLIVAADVIYNDDLTDAFFSTLERIMLHRPEKVAYLALEKRYNFTVDDLNVVANGYSRFRSYLRDEDCDDLRAGSSFACFVGKCIDLTQIPRYIREYERGSDVEIWQIKYKESKP